MKIGDKVEIVATKEQLETVGADYLTSNKATITGFYPDNWVEVKVETIFDSKEQQQFKIDLPKYYIKTKR